MNDEESGINLRNLDQPSLGSRPHDVESYVQGEKTRTVHYGLGSIGAGALRALLTDPNIEPVAAIDPHPAKAGKDLGEVAGLDRKLGITVSFDAESVLNDAYADVVVHCTGSALTEVYPQLMALIGSEKSVVSSCEELSFPWMRQPELAEKLDRRAREVGVRLLGTGVNPGFVMDLLPLMVSTVSRQVKSVRVTRVVDTSTRRGQLQRKTGAGLSEKGFEEGARGGGIGHVGLRESAFMVADTLGFEKLDEVSETLEPVLAKKRMTTEYVSIESGFVTGIRQTARAVVDNREVVRLDLEMSIGAENPRDVIEIEGTPPVRIEIPGGVSGDVATASIIANCVPFVAHSRAVGLLTMRDLPAVPYFQSKNKRRERTA